MSDNGNAPDIPVVHFAHRHAAAIGSLLDEGDRLRVAHLDGDTPQKPHPAPYGALHKYLAENQIVKTFPKTDSKEPYVLTEAKDFDDMLQDDWWLLTQALVETITGARVRARQAAKK